MQCERFSAPVESTDLPSKLAPYSLGFSSTQAHSDFESGAELSISGKEVEVDRKISQREYLSSIPERWDYPASKKSLTKQASSRATQMTSPPSFSRLMAPAPTSTFYSKPLPKLRSAEAPLEESSPKRPDGAQERQQDEAQHKRKSQSSKDPTSSKGSSSRASPAVQPRPHGLFNPKEPAEPRYDPTAPGAIVMSRPDKEHQKLYNRRNDPVVDVVVNPLLSQHLRPHQADGVRFLYERILGMVDTQTNSRGAILADEMGLGKTLQTITLIETLLRQSPYYSSSKPRVIDKALVVCPLSLVRNWHREFKKWLGTNGSLNIGVVAVDGNKGKEVAQRFVTSKRDSILIIGYEKLRSCMDILSTAQPPIGLIVCDEGHRLKSKDAKTTKMFGAMSTDRRIILTGTPIQNDLSELFAMIDFVSPGLLGPKSTFKSVFEDPILKSRMQYASPEAKALGQERSNILSTVTKLVVLRRTASILDGYLRPKSEYVIFCSPSKIQLELYRHILRSSQVRALTSGRKGSGAALPLITILRQVCDSPELLLKGVDASSAASKDSLAREVLEDALHLFPVKKIAGDEKLSGKLTALSRMLDDVYRNTSDKVVIVSTFTSTLDVLESFCQRKRFAFLRLDGKTKQDERVDLVNHFNRSPQSSSFVFLLSTRAGGVGLNLIGANRLFLMEPEWNPALDQQAMARIHRDGQKKHCHIYRMMVAGTMDEKIFQRQIQKMGLSDQLMGADDSDHSAEDGEAGAGSKRKRTGASASAGPSRKSSGDSFTPEELRDIFTLHEDTACLCHDQLMCKCGGTGEAVEEADDGDQEDSNDQLPMGFIPASQQAVQEEAQSVKEARARLAGLADWRHLETRCTGHGRAEAALNALEQDAVLMNVIKTQLAAAKKVHKQLASAEEREDGALDGSPASYDAELPATQAQRTQGPSLLAMTDLSAVEEAVSKERQAARAKAKAISSGEAADVGSWHISMEAPGNIMYVLTRQSGGEAAKKKRSLSPHRLEAVEESSGTGEIVDAPKIAGSGHNQDGHATVKIKQEKGAQESRSANNRRSKKARMAVIESDSDEGENGDDDDGDDDDDDDDDIASASDKDDQEDEDEDEAYSINEDEDGDDHE